MGGMFNGAMRVISTLIGIAMTAMGGIWILQGFNLAFLNSFMAGQLRWAFFGGDSCCGGRLSNRLEQCPPALMGVDSPLLWSSACCLTAQPGPH